MDMQEEVVPMDKLAKVYLKIRDRIGELTKTHDEVIEGLKAQQAEVANAMKMHMLALGSTSMKTDFGTVMLGLKTRYSTRDWESFKKFVVEHDAVDLLERRIAQRNMEQFLKESPDLVPPGLDADSSYEISVRKPTK